MRVRVSAPSPARGRDSEPGSEREGFIVKKKKGSHLCALMGGGWQGDVGSRLTRSGVSYVIGLRESIWPSAVGLELETGAKNREVIDLALTIPA